MAHATLSEIAKSIADRSDGISKSYHLYESYERYFSPLADQPVAMLELGVHKGDSLKVFSSYFRNGRVVGVDIKDAAIDLSAFPNATFTIGDQRDAAQLAAISRTHAPGGWDIILDDASHYGNWSLMSYEALFPLLKPGGLYVVEDWNSGYWDDWPDGSRYQRIASITPKDHIPKRVPSHDSGMAGFIKYLVDDLVARPVATRHSHVHYERRFDWMFVEEFFAILKKVQA